LQNEKNAAWFYAEPCRAEKHVQEDKKNRSWKELEGGGVFSVTIAQSTGCPLLLSCG